MKQILLLYLLFASIIPIKSQENSDRKTYMAFSFGLSYKNIFFDQDIVHSHNFYGQTYQEVLYPSFSSINFGLEINRIINHRTYFVTGLSCEFYSFDYLNIDIDGTYSFGSHGSDGPYYFMDTTLAQYVAFSIKVPFLVKINLNKSGNLALMTGFNLSCSTYQLSKIKYQNAYTFYKGDLQDQPDYIQSAHFVDAILPCKSFLNLNYVIKMMFDLPSKGKYGLAISPNFQFNLMQNFGFINYNSNRRFSKSDDLVSALRNCTYSFGVEFSIWKK